MFFRDQATCLIIPSMKPLSVLTAAGAFFVSCWAAAGEPEVTEKELPRVPPTEPGQALSTFQVKRGFHLELVAAEPLVVDPSAMAYDERGRRHVREMRDYSERRPERLGRIRRLEDTDGDGRFDKSTVYVDGLAWAAGGFCFDGGVFVGATPDILFCKDTTGDGVADVREVVFSGFASDYAPYETNRLNVQPLLNSFNWGLDNRIHGSASMSGGEGRRGGRPSVPGRGGGKVRGVDSPFVREWIGGAPPRPGLKQGPASAAPAREEPVDLRGRD